MSHNTEPGIDQVPDVLATVGLAEAIGSARGKHPKTSDLSALRVAAAKPGHVRQLVERVLLGHRGMDLRAVPRIAARLVCGLSRVLSLATSSASLNCFQTPTWIRCSTFASA